MLRNQSIGIPRGTTQVARTNSIKGRRNLTKPLGPNPLGHLGVTFSDSGLAAPLWENVDGVWDGYSEKNGENHWFESWSRQGSV